jgi:hypothetical protein
MIRNVEAMRGAEFRARDGNGGKVKDFFFDSRQWVVRYVVIETDSSLGGRTVLIATAAFSGWSSEGKVLNVELTKEQLRNSPDFDAATPVSRDYEEQLHRHFAWPFYWGGPYIGGGVDAPIAAPAAPTAVAVDAARNPPAGRAGEIRAPGGAELPGEPGGESHLRGAHAVRGYHIEATDGAVGHVEDLLIDDASWDIRYIIVDTRNWLPGRKVIISPRHVREVSWLNSSVFVELTREAIERAPAFEPWRPFNREDAERFDAHYRVGPTPL